MPFVFISIWWFVFQWDFTSQYFEKSLHVYHLFDFAQMFWLNSYFLHPLITYPFLLWMCDLWATFPELSQVWRIYDHRRSSPGSQNVTLSTVTKLTKKIVKSVICKVWRFAVDRCQAWPYWQRNWENESSEIQQG